MPQTLSLISSIPRESTTRMMFPKHLPNIICDVCNKPVRSTTVYWNEGSGQFCFTVHCHGQIDKTAIPAEVFEQGWSIVEGHAFKKIESLVSETVTILEPHDRTDDEMPLQVLPNEALDDPLPGLIGDNIGADEVEGEVVTPPLCLTFDSQYTPPEDVKFCSEEWIGALKTAI